MLLTLPRPRVELRGLVIQGSAPEVCRECTGAMAATGEQDTRVPAHIPHEIYRCSRCGDRVLVKARPDPPKE